MRYVGQGHEITVPLPVRDLTADDATALRETFEREYAVLFQRPIPGAAIEVLSWSVLISTQGRSGRIAMAAVGREARAGAGRQPRVLRRPRRAGRSTCRLYRPRAGMAAGRRHRRGPAIIAEDETIDIRHPSELRRRISTAPASYRAWNGEASMTID